MSHPLDAITAAEAAATPSSFPCTSAADPRERGGHYWGYLTRIAPSLHAMLEQCPFAGGYDLTVGTSGESDPSQPSQVCLVDGA